MRSTRFGGLTVEVYRDSRELINAAAGSLFSQLRSKKESVIGLATGSTFLPFYAKVVADYRKEGVSFMDAVTFNLDEYYPIANEDSNSYHSYMTANFFSRIDIKKANVHVPDGSAANPELEVREYEEAILRAGGIDLQFLGIGRNGHIGFNEPGTSFESRTHVTNLTDSTLAANRPLFSDSGSQMPVKAITMGIATILSARRLVLIATGETKSDALHSALKGPVTEEVPASVLRKHGNATFMVDEDAIGGMF